MLYPLGLWVQFWKRPFIENKFWALCFAFHTIQIAYFFLKPLLCRGIKKALETKETAIIMQIKWLGLMRLEHIYPKTLLHNIHDILNCFDDALNNWLKWQLQLPT